MRRVSTASTPTTGPGTALMVEAFQYALMTETPVVVVLVQRLGPSTGGATQGAQGDVLLAEFATSGGYTVPVFAPSTPVECFTLTMAPVRFGARGEVPPFAPLAGSLKVTLTGSAHNKDGWLRKNDAETLDVLRHLEAKVSARAVDMAEVSRDLQDDAETLVVS